MSQLNADLVWVRLPCEVRRDRIVAGATDGADSPFGHGSPRSPFGAPPPKRPRGRRRRAARSRGAVGPAVTRPRRRRANANTPSIHIACEDRGAVVQAQLDAPSDGPPDSSTAPGSPCVMLSWGPVEPSLSSSSLPSSPSASLPSPSPPPVPPELVPQGSSAGVFAHVPSTTNPETLSTPCAGPLGPTNNESVMFVEPREMVQLPGFVMPSIARCTMLSVPSLTLAAETVGLPEHPTHAAENPVMPDVGRTPGVMTSTVASMPPPASAAAETTRPCSNAPISVAPTGVGRAAVLVPALRHGLVP